MGDFRHDASSFSRHQNSESRGPPPPGLLGGVKVLGWRVSTRRRLRCASPTCRSVRGRQARARAHVFAAVGVGGARRDKWLASAACRHVAAHARRARLASRVPPSPAFIALPRSPRERAASWQIAWLSRRADRLPDLFERAQRRRAASSARVAGWRPRRLRCLLCCAGFVHTARAAGASSSRPC